MKAQVAKSKTRLRFIFGLKVKSKLSSVRCGSRKAACLRRRSSSRSLRLLSSSPTRHEIRSMGAMASAWACRSRVSSTTAMPPSRSCRNARSNSIRFMLRSPWSCSRCDRWAPWLPLGPVAVGFPARRRCRQAGVVVTHALIQSGSCFALLGLVLDEIAVQRELADQRIDLAQAQRQLGAPLQVAAHKAVIADAHLQGSGASFLDAGGAVLLG